MSSLLQDLPEAVAERVRPLVDREPVRTASSVVYWMHHAVRGHENPALDAAILAAVSLDLPLLVYQGLDSGWTYANDRHHTFALEGARDVRVELAARGISHVLWVGDSPAATAPLTELAERAALVVTEDFPAPPYPDEMGRLAERIAAPVWAVDAACIVPMQMVGRPHERAFQFRDAIRELLNERLRRPWEEPDVVPRAFARADLPFRDVALETTEISEVVAACAVDHSVGPILHTPGGSVAGYARWREFRDRGLGSYAARRNDAARDGVSRLSPYLHYGHVSPLRIAREAAGCAGKGPEKFLDELIVWRELAHNLCFHSHREVETLEVLPAWARETLQAHAEDVRAEILAWEALARGRTGDRLWDLCQTSLVRHGELHNNVRMTWGKAVLGWTGSPADALRVLIDLNHRFALDGSDPNSYGGLLWCLGLFDRPFEPGRPVLGAVRPRSTKQHAERLDLERYAAKVTQPASGSPLRVAVVGAGISGLVCARTLADHGHRVSVFDKARGPGGRMSTRRSDGWRFDHGAQYFTIRDPRLAPLLASWRHDGLVAPWHGRIAVVDGGDTVLKDDETGRYVGVPGMNAVCRHLATELEVQYETRVESVQRSIDGWHLTDSGGADLGCFEVLVVSAPAPQSAALLENAAPDVAAHLQTVRIAPCWAVMAAFADPLPVQFDAAFVHHSPLSWVARNASKPGRPDGEAWVLHASPEWSEAHLELDRSAIESRLLEAFGSAVGAHLPEPLHCVAHRWRYALPTQPLAEASVFDRQLKLAACGDWCGGPRVEGAMLSGFAAAGRVLALRANAGQRPLFEDA
jgi:hypothetical protein